MRCAGDYESSLSYKASGWSPKFYNEHRKDIEAHKKAQAVYSSVDGKMPTLKELSAEYDALKAEKENDDAALEVSDTALCSKLAQGPFFFAFLAKPGGRMTQENDTTTELQLWFSGAWGRSLPTSFRRSY